MAKKSQPGVTVMCIYCKDKKFISADEAGKLTSPPMCQKDGGVMIMHSANT